MTSTLTKEETEALNALFKETNDETFMIPDEWHKILMPPGGAERSRLAGLAAVQTTTILSALGVPIASLPRDAKAGTALGGSPWKTLGTTVARLGTGDKVYSRDVAVCALLSRMGLVWASDEAPAARSERAGLATVQMITILSALGVPIASLPRDAEAGTSLGGSPWTFLGNTVGSLGTGDKVYSRDVAVCALLSRMGLVWASDEAPAARSERSGLAAVQTTTLLSALGVPIASLPRGARAGTALGGEPWKTLGTTVATLGTGTTVYSRDVAVCAMLSRTGLVWRLRM